MLMGQGLITMSVGRSALLAYLDPGTGSMVLQGILAGIAVVALGAKMYWNKLLVLLRIRSAPAAAPSEQNPESRS